MSKRKKIAVTCQISTSSSDEDSPFVIEQRVEIPREALQTPKSHHSTSAKDLPGTDDDSLEDAFSVDQEPEQVQTCSESLESLLTKENITLDEKCIRSGKVLKIIEEKKLDKDIWRRCTRAFDAPDPEKFQLKQYCELLMYEFLKMYSIFRVEEEPFELSMLVEHYFPRWITHKAAMGPLKFSVAEVINTVRSWKNPSIANFIRETFGWTVHNKHSRTWKVFYQHFKFAPEEWARIT